MKAINGVTVKNLLNSKKSLVKKVEEIIDADASYIKKYAALAKLDKVEDISRSIKAEKIYTSFLARNKDFLLSLADIKTLVEDNRLQLKKIYILKNTNFYKIKFWNEDNKIMFTSTSFVKEINLNKITRVAIVLEMLNTQLWVLTNKLKTKKEIEDKNYYFIEKYLKANFGYKNNYREESNLIFGTPEVYTISKKYSLCQIKKAIARARKNKEVRKRELIKYFIIDKIGDNAPFNVSSFLGGDAKENLAKLKKARDLAKKYNVSLYKTMELKSIKEIQSTKYGSCIYADAVATVTYREVKDWNYYSKNYKHPKITVYGRKVTFEKKGYIKTVDLDNFNGDFLLKAYVKAFKVKAYKQKGFARKVQLNDYLRTKKIRCIGNVELWERTINKAHYDYCAVINKTTYHAFTKKEALSGLKKKINAKIKKEMEVISKKTGYNLGFCETGMKSFCEDNDLDLEGSYTRAELRNIILQKRKLNCDKYAPEIRKLGIILGC